MSDESSAMERLKLDQAAERVRVAALEMRSTQDLRRVAAVVFQEMVAHGIESPVVTVTFFDRATDTVHHYFGARHPRTLGIDYDESRADERALFLGDVWASGSARGTIASWIAGVRDACGDAVVVSDDQMPTVASWLDRFGPRSAADADADDRSSEDRWGAGSPPVTYEESQKPARYPTSVSEILGVTEEEWLPIHYMSGKPWFITNVPFSSGMIGFRETEHHPEHDAVVAELARGLDLGFARFLDFQQLERQNRELEIERSIEKVRTAVAGMESSADIVGINEQVKVELVSLGVPCDDVGINRYNPDNRTIQFPDTAPLPVEKMQRFGKWESRWKQRDTYVRRTTAEQDAADIAEAVETGLLSPEKASEIAEGEEKLDRWIVDAFFDRGSLAMNKAGEKAFSDDDVHLLERFTEVFALGYKRHLDLKAAEDRARQAELDLGVERVRAAAMEMTNSDELPKVVVTVLQEMIRLETGIDYAGIYFVDEEKGIVNALTALHRSRWSQDLELRTGKVGDQDRTAHIVDAGDGYFCSVNQNSVDHPEWTQPIDGWRSGQTTVTETIYEEKQVRADSLRLFVGSDEALEAHVAQYLGPRTVVNVPFQYGTIGYNSPDLADDHEQIVRALASGLELGYRRFLDFQQLEQRNRELEIGQQLERLRTQIAAMESSDDLQGLVNGLGDAIGHFGLAPDLLGIQIVDERAGTITAHGSEGLNVRPAQDFTEDWTARWRAGDAPFERTWPEETVRGFYQSIVDAGAAESVDEIASEFPITARRVIDVFFEHGSVALNRPGEEPFSDEQRQLLERFTDVFAGGYKRHLELKAAEDRTKQAELELGVERVRAASMAMGSSSDLPGVVGTLVREMRRLGVSNSAGINFIDEDAGRIDVWNGVRHPARSGLRLKQGVHVHEIDDEIVCIHSVVNFEQSEDPWMETIQAWRSDEPHTFDMELTVESLLERSRTYYEGTEEKLREVSAAYAGTYETANVPFTYGTIGYHAPKLIDGHIEIVQALAGALELGYLRYFDLKAAEKRARDAEIERSLERVRTAVAAMETSDGLMELTRTVERELTGLELPFNAVGINTVDPETDRITYRDSRAPVGVLAVELPVEFADQPLILDWREHRQAGRQCVSASADGRAINRHSRGARSCWGT
jgi:hypothetical protein